jgi:hypothetical protein
MLADHGTDIALTPKLELKQSAKLLDPTKDLFDPSPCVDRLGVDLMTRQRGRGSTAAAPRQLPFTALLHRPACPDRVGVGLAELAKPTLLSPNGRG